MVDTPPESKLCWDCKEVLPHFSFEGSAEGRCRRCVENERLKRVAGRQDERAMEGMEELASAFSLTAGTPVPTNGEVISGLISQFGSLGAFLSYWKRDLDKTKPSVGKLNHLQRVMSMIFQANAQEHNEELGRMTLEQLANAQEQMVSLVMADKMSRDGQKLILEATGARVDKQESSHADRPGEVAADRAGEAEATEGGVEALPAEPDAVAIPSG